MKATNRSIRFPRSLEVAGVLSVTSGVYTLVGALTLEGRLATWAAVLGPLEILAGVALLFRTVAGYLLAALPAAASLLLALTRGRPMFLPAVILNLGIVLLLVGSEARYWLVSVWHRRTEAPAQVPASSGGVPWRPAGRIHADPARTRSDAHPKAA